MITIAAARRILQCDWRPYKPVCMGTPGSLYFVPFLAPKFFNSCCSCPVRWQLATAMPADWLSDSKCNQLLIIRLVVAIVAAIALKCPSTNNSATSSLNKILFFFFCFYFFSSQLIFLLKCLEIFNNRIKISFVVVLAFGLADFKSQN